MTKQHSPEYTYHPSRRKDEEAEFKKKLALYGVITIGILALLFYFAPSLISSIGSFWLTVNGNKTSLNQDSTKTASSPELPPQIETLPLYTNKDLLEIKGTATAGHLVEVWLNKEKLGETVVGNDNQFNYLNIRLIEGDNKIEVYSKTLEGTRSNPSSTIINYDRRPPKLELNPPNADTSVAKETTQVTISGTSDSDALITVNDIQVVVNANGGFSKVVGITDGVNPIKVEATDQANNKKKIEFKITR